MKRGILLFLALCLVSTMSFAGGRRSRSWGSHSFNIHTGSDTNSDACADQLQISSDDFDRHAEAESETTVANQLLHITAAHNGGIHVKQWDRNEIGIKICKAAIAVNDAEAQKLLQQVKLNVSGARVTVEGPDSNDSDGRWSALLMVHVPKNAQLDLDADNGGISFNRVQVNATAHTRNGGISLNRASGRLDVEAQNGGVSVKDCNGDIKVNVQNGGVALKLGDTWTGAGLEANTHNGGLSVEVPKNFHSSLEVTGSRHVGFNCRSSVCTNGQRTWNDDGDRILRIGTGTPVIRTSTINGGVIVRDRGASDDDDTI